MTKKQVLQSSEEFVRRHCENMESGHDWWHIERVRNLSLTISKSEACNPYIVELAALFHDIADTKFNHHKESDAEQIIQQFLKKCNVDQSIIDRVVYLVNCVSFRKSLGTTIELNPELAVVMDADRLDAIGAIGVARAFSFGGHKQRSFYDPDEQPKLNMSPDEYQKRNSSTINHFYEKLLLLKDQMNTNTGKKMAEQRHHFMLMFLDQFYDEWNGQK